MLLLEMMIDLSWRFSGLCAFCLGDFQACALLWLCRFWHVGHVGSCVRREVVEK